MRSQTCRYAADHVASVASKWPTSGVAALLLLELQSPAPLAQKPLPWAPVRSVPVHTSVLPSVMRTFDSLRSMAWASAPPASDVTLGATTVPSRRMYAPDA